MQRRAHVVFMDADAKGLLASTSFERALRVLGARAVPLPGYPPRWEVKELPPRAELERLGRLPGF